MVTSSRAWTSSISLAPPPPCLANKHTQKNSCWLISMKNTSNKGTRGVYHRENKIVAEIFSTHWLSMCSPTFASPLAITGSHLSISCLLDLEPKFLGQCIRVNSHLPVLSFPSPKMMETPQLSGQATKWKQLGSLSHTWREGVQENHFTYSGICVSKKQSLVMLSQREEVYLVPQHSLVLYWLIY